LTGTRRAELFKRIRGVPYFCIINRGVWDSESAEISVIEFPAEKYTGTPFPYSAENFMDWINGVTGKDKILRIENNLKITEVKNTKSVKSSRGPNFIIEPKNS
jgi:hypothetical protein